MASRITQIEEEGKQELAEHSWLKAFFTKFMKDNVGMLAGYVSWNILTSLVPIIVRLVAISGFFLRSPSAQASVVSHLRAALQGAFSTSEIKSIVRASSQHAGLLGIVGLLGVLWGGSNVGGAFSTAFQAIFEVKGRNFIKEKLIDIGMIFVFTALMLIILGATSASAILNRLFSGFPCPGWRSSPSGPPSACSPPFCERIDCPIPIAQLGRVRAGSPRPSTAGRERPAGA